MSLFQPHDLLDEASAIGGFTNELKADGHCFVYLSTDGRMKTIQFIQIVMSDKNCIEAQLHGVVKQIKNLTHCYQEIIPKENLSGSPRTNYGAQNIKYLIHYPEAQCTHSTGEPSAKHLLQLKNGSIVQYSIVI